LKAKKKECRIPLVACSGNEKKYKCWIVPGHGPLSCHNFFQYSSLEHNFLYKQYQTVLPRKMCSPSILLRNKKNMNNGGDVSSHFNRRIECCSISMPITVICSDDAMSCYSEVSYDGDENAEQDDVDRWAPSPQGCHSICVITIPLPRLLPVQESRWNATVSKTTIDSPPMYYNINRKRQRPAELPSCNLRDVPFRAPVRFIECDDSPASSFTCLQRPQGLAGASVHRQNNPMHNKNECEAISLHRTIDFLDAALEIVNDDVYEY
jgi:hypothetical protein